MPSFVRASGFAAILGGLIIAPAGALAWADAWRSDIGDAKQVADASLVAAFLLLLTSFVGLHLRQRHIYGGLGRAGFYLAIGGLASVIALFLVGFVLVPIGLILFGLATLRAGVVDRRAALLFTASVPTAVVAWMLLSPSDDGEYATLLFLALHSPAWVWLGWSLLRGTGVRT